MRVVHINLTAHQGGTGRVVYGISKALEQSGYESYTLFSTNEEETQYELSYARTLRRKGNALVSRVLGNYGFNCHLITRRLISRLKRLKPDIVHLHNLHGHNANLNMLFKYLKKNPQIKLFWTFHDCWSFTGYCAYFDVAECDKWKFGCGNCPQKKQYSWFFDKSKRLYERKRMLFTGLDLTVITPSEWLANLARQTFFKEYEIKVINNGIDLDIFKPTESDFREKYNLQSKKVVLGVAFNWEARKGLDCIIELSKRLLDNYQIVLVGTNDNIDKQLPNNIISIHKTNNQRELAEIYTASDVFVNPTREENFPTVNMEALACGTPVVTFKTGGSPEIIDESCGSVVEKNDVDSLTNEIIRICEEKPYFKEACRKRAEDNFDKNANFRKYIEMYQKQ